MSEALTTTTPLTQYDDYAEYITEVDPDAEDFVEARRNLDMNLEAEEEVLEGEDFEQSHVSQEPLNDFSCSPMEPFTFVAVMLMHLLIGHCITDEFAEIIMAFLNVLLYFAGKTYRFPVKVCTFKSNSRLEERVCSGLTTYVSCTQCHSIYDIPGSNNERDQRKKCTFAKRVSTYGSNVLQRCENDLYDIRENGEHKTFIPKAYYMYNSVIETLKKFYMRDGFFEAVSAWKSRKLVHLDYMFDCYDAHVFRSFKLDPSHAVPSSMNLIIILCSVLTSIGFVKSW
ncbi:unnamed protein product [Mucor hiemalis]